VLALGGAGSSVVSSGGTLIQHSGAVVVDTRLNTGGSVDFPELSFSSGGTAGLDENSNLVVTMGGVSATLSIDSETAQNVRLGVVHFNFTSDPAGGTVITEEQGPPCYRRGTLILTDRGEAAIEHLRTGDLVRTALTGTTQPIVWIGRRHIDCRHHPAPRKVWPVRVAAGAFADNVPHRDLWLSPDHAVLLSGVLIPIRHLRNGRTVAQEPMDDVTYYHIELARHDVLLAEGLPAESYLDTGDRGSFENGGVVALHPEFSARRENAARIWEARGCAPLIVSGPRLDAARLLVNARAAGGAHTAVARFRA
jgi:hypothetical protein